MRVITRFLIFSTLTFFSTLSQGHADFKSVDRTPSGIQVEALRGELGASSQTREPRRLLTFAIDMVKTFEGWEPKPYNDASNYCTIGYGHLLALKPCHQINLGEFESGITEERGRELLVEDTVLARIAIQDLIDVEISDEQFGALTSFVYNVGSANFQNSTLRRKLNGGDYSGSANEFRRWVYSKGVLLRGLQVRRNCERQLYDGDLSDLLNNPFQRAMCEQLGVASSSVDPIDILEGEQ